MRGRRRQRIISFQWILQLIWMWNTKKTEFPLKTILPFCGSVWVLLLVSFRVTQTDFMNEWLQTEYHVVAPVNYLLLFAGTFPKGVTQRGKIRKRIYVKRLNSYLPFAPIFSFIYYDYILLYSLFIIWKNNAVYVVECSCFMSNTKWNKKIVICHRKWQLGLAVHWFRFHLASKQPRSLVQRTNWKRKREGEGTG